MEMHFDDAEGGVLHGLLEKAAGDIVVRLDAAGFVLHASANIDELGIDLTSLLVMPHISDFAERGYGDAVARHVGDALGKPLGLSGEGAAGSGPEVSAQGSRKRAIGTVGSSQRSKSRERREARRCGGWIEFPVLRADTAPASAPSIPAAGEAAGTQKKRKNKSGRRRWFALSLQPILSGENVPDGETSQGALALLRPVERHHRLEGQLSARAAIDPLTGLGNRRGFCASLRRQLSRGSAELCIAIVAVDRVQAIMLQHGQHAADEIQWGFARFLEAMVQPGQELAQLDGERFGVILPGMTAREAKVWAHEALRTFGELADPDTARQAGLTASAGIARAELNVEWTLRQAELALVMARAGGGMQAVFRGQRKARRLAEPLPRIMKTIAPEAAADQQPRLSSPQDTPPATEESPSEPQAQPPETAQPRTQALSRPVSSRPFAIVPISDRFVA